MQPLAPETLAEARALADEHGALLVFDEVQTGVGRTGAFFAWQSYGVRPDAVTLAKGLANGLPIGALLVADDAPTGFVPGDHASTFGGNPVACAAACAVVDTIDDDAARPRARDLGAAASRPRRVRLRARRSGSCSRSSSTAPPRPVVAAALEHGLVLGSAGEHTLRAHAAADDHRRRGRLGARDSCTRC